MSVTQSHYRVQEIAVVLAAISIANIAAAHAADVPSVTVFLSGQDGYHTYRIPAIVRATSGDLLAFAEGRKNAASDHGDIDIVLKRSHDNGRTWEPIQVVQDEPRNPAGQIWIGNPTPVVDRMDPEHKGRIWLAFTRTNARMYVASSDDNGRTWSQRRDIAQTAANPAWDWYATGPVHGIQLERGSHAGRLVIPCDHRDRANKGWGAHVVYSDDHGATWKLGAADTRAATDRLHPNECVAVELVDGRIYVNARDQNGFDPASRCIAYCSDGGETFDAPFVAQPGITSPVVQNSLVRFSAIDRGDKENMLVYCGPGDPKRRRDLTIRLSFDEGKTWRDKTLIHSGPAGYSDLVKLDDEHVGVLFEAGRRLYDEIDFASLRPGELANP
ncbi:MAG TPA: sialidase family protein [Lacipirellulaceae bacterium]|nr:sialidase family protein [Lacipirellulaceae bacterium]